MGAIKNTIAAATAAATLATSAPTHVETIWGDTVPLASAQAKYGCYWNKSDHPVMIELRSYLLDLPQETGGLGAVGHFREAVSLIWGENEQKQFIWNPWADKMLEESIRWKYLSVAGCASAGKSDFYSVWAIVNWLADPVNTMVLVTSTSLKESRGRIWGAVEEYFNAAQHKFGGALPGKLVTSVGIIKLDDPEFKTSDRSGIHLIAGEKKKEKESIGKLIGLKNQRVFLIGDELPELSHALVEAACGNLDANPFFQFIGIGNPNSIYDPHGVLSTPKAGWKSVNPSVQEWETMLGYCIRFDAYQSPNVLAGRVIYKWLPTQSKIDAKKEDLREDSLAFWRMWRAFWCPNGTTETVVSEADIIGNDCEKTGTKFKDGTYRKGAFLDPSFTNGGDRSIAYFGNLGISTETDLETLEFTEYVMLSEDTMNTKETRAIQIATQFKKECEKRNIPPDMAGVDDTGAAAFGDIVHTVWSKQVRRTNFGGKPTQMPVSAHDKTLSCDKYANRVTEIWCSIREYMRGNQIRGVCPDLGTELTTRRMVQKKSGIDLKAQVEPKEKMRDRTGKSPDIADAALGLLDLFRAKCRFRAAAKLEKNAISRKTWKDVVKKKDFFGQYGVALDRSV